MEASQSLESLTRAPSSVTQPAAAPTTPTKPATLDANLSLLALREQLMISEATRDRLLKENQR
jgi:hypothetical protein